MGKGPGRQPSQSQCWGLRPGCWGLWGPWREGVALSSCPLPRLWSPNQAACTITSALPLLLNLDPATRPIAHLALAPHPGCVVLGAARPGAGFSPLTAQPSPATYPDGGAGLSVQRGRLQTHRPVQGSRRPAPSRQSHARAECPLDS